MSLPGMALAFLAGIVCVETRDVLTSAALCASPLAFLALLLAFIRPSCVPLLLAGAGWAAWSAAADIAGDLESSVEGRDVLAVGEVVSLPERSEHQVQFDFAPRAAAFGRSDAAAGSNVRLPPRVRLSWYEAGRAPRAGERWQLEMRLRQRRGFSNPGGFDYEGQLFREGIGALGYVRASESNRLLGAGKAQPVLTLRERIVAALSKPLAGSQARGVLIGLAVGDTSGIPADAWRVFSRTGTTHLVAISGLHITMIATLVMGLVRVTWRMWPGPLRGTRGDIAVVCGGLAAIAYSVLAGFSVPTQRTVAMLAVAFCAGFLRRRAPPSVVLSLALFMVLLIDPHAVLAPGFWLSFLAVAGILLVVRPGGGTWSETANFFRAQGAVTVLLLPATLTLFGSVSLIAPLANLLAVPVFTLVLVPATLLGVACLGVAPAAADAVLRFAATAFEWTWPVLEGMAAVPGALSFPPPASPLLLVALAVSAVATLTVLVGRLKLLSLVLLVPLFLAKPVRMDKSGFEVTVLDVGQGLSVLVETRTRVLVYDAGPAFRSGRSAGELVVLPFLRQRAIGQVDRFVVSHDDADHAGGAAAIARELPVDSWRHGSSRETRSSRCTRGEAWTWDDVRFQFLHPPGSDTESGNGAGRHGDNDDSCVLHVSSTAGSLLIMGDVGHRVEEWLVSQSLVQPVDLVVVAHHGSRTSSAPSFVRAAGAKLAIVSAGYRNRWGFPHQDVVARWCEAGTVVVDTASWGAVSVVMAAGMQPPLGHRGSHRRYWHARAGQRLRTLCYHPSQLSGASAPTGWQ
jgi:competence protein ComEC